MAEFGEQLKKARELKGLMQQSLADLLYVSRNSISRWETGARYPDLVMLKKLSLILEVSCDELLGNERMCEMVEKVSVIEKPIMRGLLIVLYTIIVFTSIVQFGTALCASNVIDDLAGGHYYAWFMAIKELMEAGLFIYYLCHVLKGDDCPKMDGLVMMVFFMLEMISRTHTIFQHSHLSSLVIAILCLIPYLLGDMGAYLFFMKHQRDALGMVLVIFASLFGMMTQGMNLSILLSTSRAYISMPYVLMTISRFCIYISFCYQVYILRLRRNMAKE